MAETIRTGPLLEALRRVERAGAEVGLALLDDLKLAVLVAHWADVGCSCPDEVEVGAAEGDLDAAWRAARVDWDLVATMLDVDVDEAVRKVQRAAALRLVWPDGTTNAAAVKAARTVVMAEIRRRTET